MPSSTIIVSNKRAPSRVKSKKKNPNSQDATIYSYINNPPRAIANTTKVFRCVQNALFTSFFGTNIAIPTFASVSFMLSQIDQVADFASVFDQYRIDSVEVYLTNQGSNLNITNTGRLITVLDYDDSTALTTLGQAEDYANAQTSSCQSCQYRHFVPRMAVAAYSGAFTSFANTAPMWIDMASSGVAHYGVKIAASVTSSVMNFDLQIRYHLSFRQVR